MYIKGSFMTIDPDVVSAFLFYGAVATFKTLLMTFVTAYHRTTKKIYANPEDASALNGRVNLAHPDVERVRRAHLNDMENIFPFLFLGAAYCATNPSAFVATNVFRLFTLSRIVHTLVYLFESPQPSRFTAFFVAMLCNVFMAVVVLVHFF